MKQNSAIEVSVRDAGRRGGRATLEKYGRDYFKIIGRRGGQKTKELYRDLFRKNGRKGGRPQKPEIIWRKGKGLD